MESCLKFFFILFLQLWVAQKWKKNLQNWFPSYLHFVYFICARLLYIIPPLIMELAIYINIASKLHHLGEISQKKIVTQKSEEGTYVLPSCTHPHSTWIHLCEGPGSHCIISFDHFPMNLHNSFAVIFHNFEIHVMHLFLLFISDSKKEKEVRGNLKSAVQR